MARPKSFDSQKTLDAMMATFWRKGYEATSMKDLETASNLSTGSIYNEFGSKRDLFSRTLEHYIETVISKRIEKYLECENNHMAGIRSFLQTCYRDVPEPFRNQSCLLVNSAAELGQSDEKLGPQIRSGLGRVDKALIGAIKSAQKDGEISPNIDCKAAGLQISLLMPGLLIAAKNSQQHALLDELVDYTLGQFH